MKKSVDMNACYRPSEEIVSRDIEGEIILVPLTTGFSDDPDAFFTLNETGKAIWEMLDGSTTLQEVVLGLSDEYDAQSGSISTDVESFVSELIAMKMVEPYT